MRPLLAALDPGTATAFYVFAIAGLAIALALVSAGAMTLKKDRKTARFYIRTAGVCCGVALLLILIAVMLGKEAR
jgi:MFS-type transporter involved in bile tolerance (Atg22 family)